MSSPTRQIVDTVLETEAGSIPAPVLEASARVVLDTMACTVGAFETAPGSVVADLKRCQGGAPQATLAVTGDRMPVASVAYVHAQLASLLDGDETLMTRWHIAAAIVGPALAAAEHLGATGREFLAAVALGYDITARVARSLRTTEVLDDGTVRNAAVVGYDWAAFGTTAAVGRLLRLSADELANALGIAFVSTPVNYDLVRHNEKYFTAGASMDWHKNAMYGAIAEAGVNGALLAHAGFRAEPRVLDPDTGFWAAFGAVGYDAAGIVERLGERWFVTETRLKRFPSVMYATVAIELFEELVTSHNLDAADIAQVDVVIPKFPRLARVVTNNWPDEPLKIAQTLPYALWMVLRRVPPGPQWWEPFCLADDEGRLFATRVRCREEESRADFSDAAILAGLDGIPVRVEVSGARDKWVASADHPREVDGDQLATKVAAFASGALGERCASALVNAARGLADAPDVHELVHSLVADGAMQ